jgi:hypothetical protein
MRDYGGCFGCLADERGDVDRCGDRGGLDSESNERKEEELHPCYMLEERVVKSVWVKSVWVKSVWVKSVWVKSVGICDWRR